MTATTRRPRAFSLDSSACTAGTEARQPFQVGCQASTNSTCPRCCSQLALPLIQLRLASVQGRVGGALLMLAEVGASLWAAGVALPQAAVVAKASASMPTRLMGFIMSSRVAYLEARGRTDVRGVEWAKGEGRCDRVQNRAGIWQRPWGGVLIGAPMRMLARRTTTMGMLLALLTAVGSTGCASSQPQVAHPAAGRADFDRPAPAGAARALASYLVDLVGAADCETQFDLKVYADRRIELVSWDAQDGCKDRAIDVRYLSEGLSEPQLFNLVRKFARSAERQPKR